MRSLAPSSESRLLTGEKEIVEDLLDFLDVAEFVGLEHVKQIRHADAVVSHADRTLFEVWDARPS